MIRFFLLLTGLVPVALTHAQTDQLIVTATRQTQSIYEYAGAISQLNFTRLNELAFVHPAETLNHIAGVNIHRGSGQEHLTAIRSPVLTGGAGAGSFLYLEDGIPLRAAGFANVNGLFEGAMELASTVEVVKGPGSVLYGSNALHGLINILSAPPNSNASDRLRLVFGKDGYTALTASLSGTAGTTDAARISVHIAHDNGFRADSGYDQQKIQFRYDGTWHGLDLRWLNSWQNLNQETAGFVEGENAYLNPALAHANSFPEAFRDGRSFRTSLRIDSLLTPHTRLTLTPYGRWTDLQFLRHFVPGQALEDNGHISAGLLTTLYGSDYIFGFDTEYTDGFITEFQDNPDIFSFIQGAHYDYQVKSLVLSAYGQKTFALAARIQLTLGVRADYTDYVYDNQIDSGTFGRFLRLDDRRDNFFILTPKLDLKYNPSQHSLLYFRAARGARAPQISDLYSLQRNQTPDNIAPETLDSLELGYKWQPGRFQLQIAAFYQWKNNFFFRNANGTNITNGQTRHTGLELSWKGDFNDWLSTSGSFTFARHSYAFSDVVASAENTIMNGNIVDSAPKTLAQISLKARPTQKLRLEFAWQHVGSYFTDPGNIHRYPGHNIFTWRGQYHISDSLNLQARINNLFDKTYADRADFAFGTERYFPARPRTLFVGLTSHF